MRAVAARVAARPSHRLAGGAAVTRLTWVLAGGAPGARTQNPRIKSPLLYH